MKGNLKRTVQKLLLKMDGYRGKAIKQHLGELYSEDISVRIQAIEKLEEIRDQRVSTALCSAVLDPKWVTYRIWVAERYIQFREWDESSNQMVDGHIESAHWEERSDVLLFLALRAIAKQSPDLAVKLGCEFAKNHTYDVPINEYYKLFSEINSKYAQDCMVDLYRSGFTGMEIALYLKRFWKPSDPSEAVPFYVAMNDWRPIIEIGEEAFEPLLRIYHPDSEKAWNILNTMGEIGDERVLELLRKKAQYLLKNPTQQTSNDYDRIAYTRNLVVSARIFVKFLAPEATEFCREALRNIRKLHEVADFIFKTQDPQLLPDLFSAAKRCNDMRNLGFELEKIKNIPFLLIAKDQKEYCDLDQDVRNTIDERIQYGPDFKTQYDLRAEKMRAAFSGSQTSKGN